MTPDTAVRWSSRDLKRLFLLAACAFVLRAAAALLIQHRPLFPAYYYQDAVLTDTLSRQTLAAWKQGAALPLDYSPAQRLVVFCTAALYRLFGLHALIPMLANALLGALGVFALGALAARAFGPSAGLLAAGAVAVWPSEVFYTSQNLKEAPTQLFLWLAFAALLPGAENESVTTPRLAAGLMALTAAALLRPYLLIAAVAALGLGAVWNALRRKKERAAAWTLTVAVLAAPLIYQAVSRLTFDRLLPATRSAPNTENVVVPVAVDASGARLHPYSPAAIENFRRLRQSADRNYSRLTAGRQIQTQLFPDARFAGWLDVAEFIPQSAFYVLFMPLPGLYPMDGKLGRLLAAAENVVLLALAVLGVMDLARGPKTPARAAAVLFLVFMAAGSALLELDLGSAARHKLLYLPLIFPFAAEELLRLFGRSRRATER